MRVTKLQCSSDTCNCPQCMDDAIYMRTGCRYGLIPCCGNDDCKLTDWYFDGCDLCAIPTTILQAFS